MLNSFEFNLYLIRHGESEVNVQPDRMGQTADINLTANGRHQAHLLHEHMFYDDGVKNKYAYDLAYSSPYVRALDTAMIVTGTKYITLVPELREYDAGDWTNGSRSALVTDAVKSRMNYLNMAFKPPNGESQNMVERRASEWLEKEILYNQEKHDLFRKYDRPLEILVFSHGMTKKHIAFYYGV
jgi:broad specificity phosphatase PhoE